MESETSDSELKLSNATRRLLKLESDVALLKEKALNTSTSANSTEKDADDVNALAERLKKVPVISRRVKSFLVFTVLRLQPLMLWLTVYAGSGFRAERQVQQC